jgi:hypothetical protein
MTTPAAITAVIARPHPTTTWTGRYVYSFGAPTDLGPILHRLAHAAHAADGIDALARALLDEHYGWNRLDPVGERLGECRCHDPVPAAPSWPDTAPLSPGQCGRAQYAYLLTPTHLRVDTRVNGAWRHLGQAAYTRPTTAVRFDRMSERAHTLHEAHAFATDPLN